MSYPRIVVDTNKIIAAAIKPGRVRTILYQAPIRAIAPMHLLDEAGRHADTLAGRAGMSREDFLLLLELLVRDRVTLARPTQPFAGEARRVAASFDPDDWPFIALALEYEAPIWTNDRGLIRDSLRTGEYRALDTRGLEMLLNGVSWEEIREYLWRRYCGNL